MRPLPIEPVAGMPGVVRGVAVIRGAPTPVVDLAMIVAGEAAAPAPQRARFVTLRVGKRRVALLVDEVAGVVWLDGAMLSQAPPLLEAAGERWLAALGALDRELVLELRPARLVPDEVWLALDRNSRHDAEAR